MSWQYSLIKDGNVYKVVEYYPELNGHTQNAVDLSFHIDDPDWSKDQSVMGENPDPEKVRSNMIGILTDILKDLYRCLVMECTTDGYTELTKIKLEDICQPIFLIEDATEVTSFKHEKIDYKLIVYKYNAKPNSWSTTKAVLVKDSNEIDVVKQTKSINHGYSSFPHKFVVHKDIPYLISVGESYMEMMITRLTDFVSTTVSFRHEQFCPFSFNVIGDELHVVGCYWAASWDNYRIFDFTDPMNPVQTYNKEKLEIWEDVFYHHGPKEVCWIPPEDQIHLYTYTEREGLYVRYFIFGQTQLERRVYFKTISEAEEYLKEYGKRVEPRQNYEWLKSLGWR